MNSTVRRLLLAVLLVAVPVGAYFWVFRPANSHIKVQQAATEAKNRKLADLGRALIHISDLDAEVAKLREAVEVFEAKLPAEHEIHKVLDEVAKIANKQQLETKLFQTQKVKPFAKHWEQPIKMEIVGDFMNYYQFLLDIEKMPRITRIRDLEIKRECDSGKICAKFMMSIFFDRSGKGKSS